MKTPIICRNVTISHVRSKLHFSLENKGIDAFPNPARPFSGAEGYRFDSCGVYSSVQSSSDTSRQLATFKAFSIPEGMIVNSSRFPLVIDCIGFINVFSKSASVTDR
jgi:hypothetical protein